MMNRFTHAVAAALLALTAAAAGPITDAIRRAKPGEVIELKGGRYSEVIALDGLRKQGRPITLRAAAGERVILDGTVPITPKWTLWKDGIYRAKLDHAVWQLFAGDKLVYLARWPDASFEDGSLWRMTRSCRTADGGYNKRKKSFTGKSRLGVLYDDSFKSHANAGFHEGDSRYEAGAQPGSLADSGKDFTGAVAVLNIGHWLTWARTITKHSNGADHFSYDSAGIKESMCKPHSAYYIYGLAALDRANEWWFDAATKTIYYMPPEGVDPNTMELRARCRDYALELSKCANIRFVGIDFFAAGFFLDHCDDIQFENCRFDYASTHKYGLGKYGWFRDWATPAPRNRASSVFRGERNSFINCEFRRSNAPVFLSGRRVLVENCLFEDIEWDVNSNGASGTVMVGEGSTIRRCTLRRAGNSEGIRPKEHGVLIELNRISDVGNLQHDGAAINVGTTRHIGSRVVRNWVYDCNRQGVRFDYSGTGILRPDGKVHGDGLYLRNVTWNTQPNQVKGDRHVVLNNTIVSCNRYPDPKAEAMNMSVQGFKAMHEIEGNADSLTRNNIANLTHRSWNLKGKTRTRKDGYEQPGAYVLPGVNDHNLRQPGAAYTYLRDPQNHDFRPKRNPRVVDAGAVVSKGEIKSPVVQFAGLKYLGGAPDIGAYEHGAKRYWIPGRQGPTATSPVPRDGAVDVPLDADLMFLEAYRCTKHEVHFGEAPDKLLPIAELNDATTNIVRPPALQAGKTHFWKVVNGNQSSPVWSFATRQ